MIEVFGNLWEYKADVKCITTNGYIRSDGGAVMGRGVAKQASVKYPDLQMLLGYQLKRHGNHVVHIYPPGIICFPVKHSWQQPADLKLIERSAQELVQLVEMYKVQNGWKTIVLPRPGCGNGQLRWEDVKPVIEPILDDRFHVIDLPG